MHVNDHDNLKTVHTANYLHFSHQIKPKSVCTYLADHELESILIISIIMIMISIIVVIIQTIIIIIICCCRYAERSVQPTPRLSDVPPVVTSSLRQMSVTKSGRISPFDGSSTLPTGGRPLTPPAAAAAEAAVETATVSSTVVKRNVTSASSSGAGSSYTSSSYTSGTGSGSSSSYTRSSSSGSYVTGSGKTCISKLERVTVHGEFVICGLDTWIGLMCLAYAKASLARNVVTDSSEKEAEDGPGLSSAVQVCFHFLVLAAATLAAAAAAVAPV